MIQNVTYNLDNGDDQFDVFKIYNSSLKIQVYFEDFEGQATISVLESTEENGEFVEVENSSVELAEGTTSHLYTWLNAKRGTFGRVCLSNVEASGMLTRIVIKQ